jgi:hypothetical protein
MSERSSFYRKIVYGVVIIALLFPIAWLAMPATATKVGGKLAQIRSDPSHPFSQSSLGDVDPASETMKLATLGLRGVAVNLLWEKANYYKKVEDWTNLTATLEQLAKLQPNFITFWKFQAWNLTYNVSVEFDDYHDRYYYVRRGIDFLKQGERYNKDNPHLLWDLGWFFGQKIGRADEHVQYRRLFKNDDDFHGDERRGDERDNWLVAKDYYEKGIEAVDNKGRSLDRKSPRIFYSSPAMSQMNYAEAIEEEGFFDKARRAWINAQEEWERFGQLVLEHSTGVPLKLGDQPRLEAEVARLEGELDLLDPGVRERLEEVKREQLTPIERAALDTPANKRTDAQMQLAYTLQSKLDVTDRDVASEIAKSKPELAKQALQLVGDLERTKQRLRFTINYKSDSNYDYWYTRAQLEQTPNALGAREDMFKAVRAFREGDLLTAKQLYQDGFAKWRKVFDEFPMAIESESSTGDDLIQYFVQYRDVLDQLDEEMDDTFPLWDVIERFDSEQKFQQELTAHMQRTGQLPPAGQTPAEGAAAPSEQPPASDSKPAN